MSILKLAIRNGQTQFRPGETLEGVAGWQLGGPPRSVEVRLFWHTQGKGTEDLERVASLAFDDPRQEEARPFQFQLPRAPYSFSGKLISLMWELELVAQPGDHSTRLPITLAPSGAGMVR
jgi:hypothetical protein